MIDIYSEENANVTVSWVRRGRRVVLTGCRSISFLEARSGKGEFLHLQGLWPWRVQGLTTHRLGLLDPDN